MAFRRRNVKIVGAGGAAAPQADTAKPATTLSTPGVRQSPLDGRLVTSTGTRSLDALLAGHGGLPLGTSLLIEEDGTTDFAGALLRYYAAEGVLHGHQVHIFGMGEPWTRELPGVASSDREKSTTTDKMKIAWRYERLGEFGNSLTRERAPATGDGDSTIFCHEFDLGTRLAIPSMTLFHFVPVPPTPLDFGPVSVAQSPYMSFLQRITSRIASMPSTTVHRVVIPSLLSPAIYPPSSTRPEHLLPFLHALRALLRRFPSQLTLILTLPLTLQPRSSGLTRWVELLSDGVIQLTPFPTSSTPVNGAATVQEEPPQGILRVHRLPVVNEKGGGGDINGAADDWAFNLSRRKGLVIKPYNLPPVEGDTEAQAGATGGSSKAEMEF